MPENAVAHCFVCHQWYGSNPVIGGDWARDFLGVYVVDMLIEKHNTVIKLTKYDMDELYIHYKAEYARLLRERDAGDTSILFLPGYL